MVFSATSIMAFQKYGSEFYYFSRHSIAVILGIIIMFLLSKLPYQVWHKLTIPIIIIQIIAIGLTHFPSFGHEALGANRWLKLGEFRFQPSELIKISVACFLAYLITKNQIKKFSLLKLILAFLPIGILTVLLLSQPDLGTVILIVAVIIGVLFISGIKSRYIVSFLGISFLLLALALYFSDYRRKRIFSYINPWADPQGTGFQTIQSFLSFHSGSIFGVGPGNGNSKLFYLPEVHTDFIFALLGEEFGFIGVTITIILYLYLCFLLFKICLKAKDVFGKIFGFSLTLFLILQISINLGGVTGLLPVKGIPLPFLSWGRSALLVNLASIGILLNILRQSEIIKPRC